MLSFFLSFVSSEIKFNKLDHLLPYKSSRMRKNPSIVISSTGSSCVNWENASPELIHVTPIGNGRCSKQAKIEVICNSNNRRRVATVFTSSRGSNQQTPLTFYIDDVQTLSIKTSTKALFLDSAARTFQLIGYDSNNNTFDTLSGLNVNFKEDREHLRIEKTNESASSVSLIGTKIGHSSLTATIDDKSVTVPVIVSYRIKIFPGPSLHIPVGYKVPLRFCAVREFQEDENEGEGTCTQHFVYNEQKMFKASTTDSGVLSVDDSLVALGHKNGKASVLLKDVEVENNVAKVEIFVEKISRVETKTHYIKLGDEPTFNPIFYCSHRKMDLFEKPQPKLLSGEWNTLGTHEITFSFYGFTYKEVVVVCAPLKVEPTIILPVPFTMKFPVEGGSGEYIYTLSEKGVISVKSDILKTNSEGEVSVKIEDEKIPGMTISTKVIVSKIKSASSKISDSEITIGSNVNQFTCSFYARNKKEYSVDIPYTVSSDSKLDEQLTGIEEGVAGIWCTDDIQGFTAPKKRVAIFKNLSINVDGRAAPNSTIPLTIEGGPFKWNDGKKKELRVSCPGVSTKILSESTFSVNKPFEGKCTATIKNEADQVNFKPIEMKTSFELSVSNVHVFTGHATDKLASAAPVCLAPSTNTEFINNLVLESQKVVNAAKFHNITIFSVARNSKGQSIKYHDAIKEEILIDNTKVNTTHNKKLGALVYNTFAENCSKVTINSKVGMQNMSINIIQPFNVPQNNFFYASNEAERAVKLSGGSGHFALVYGNGNFTDNLFTPSDYAKGVYKYDIRDICTDQSPVSVSVTMFDVKKLVIEKEGAVMADSLFTYKVKAYTANGKLITDKFRKFIDIKTNAEAEEIEPLTFRIRAKGNKFMELHATVSRITATKTIKIVKPITISPNVITLLPTQTDELRFSSEPEDIVLDGYDPDIISLTGKIITAIRPGTTKILASSSEVADMEPIEVTVIVPEPKRLFIVSTSETPIKGGILGLNLFVETDKGTYEVPSAHWIIPNNFDFEVTRPSYALINLTARGRLNIHIKSLGLTLDYIKTVESKLVLPHEILLAPLTSYNIPTPMDCTYKIIENNNLATVSNSGLLQTGNTTGTIVLNVSSKLQSVIVIVNIEIPYSLIIKVCAKEMELNAILVNNRSQTFDSIDGIKFTSPSSTLSQFTGSSAVMKLENANNQTVEVNAFNNAFVVSKSVNILQPTIVPMSPVLLLGSYLQMDTNAPKPKWSSSNRVATITRGGLVRGRKLGVSVIDDGKGSKTNATVVKVEKLLIEPISHTTVHVHPIFNQANIDYRQVHMPQDLRLDCYSQHGLTTPIINESGYYCMYSTNEEKFTISATLRSYSTRMYAKGKRVLKPAKKFLIPDGFKVELSQEKKKAVVKIANNKTDIELITKPQSGISVAFMEVNGTVEISVDDQASLAETEQTLVFKSLDGDLVRVDVNLDKVQFGWTPQTKKRTPIMQFLFVSCVVISLCSIYVILLQLGFA